MIDLAVGKFEERGNFKAISRGDLLVDLDEQPADDYQQNRDEADGDLPQEGVKPLHRLFKATILLLQLIVDGDVAVAAFLLMLPLVGRNLGGDLQRLGIKVSLHVRYRLGRGVMPSH